MSALAVETGAINLGQGFPDTDGPPEVLDAADRRHPGRASTSTRRGPGIPELRTAIADHQRRFYGLELDPDAEVLVTAGATEAIAGALLGCSTPATRSSCSSRCTTATRPASRWPGARAVPVLLAPDDAGRYAFDPDDLRAAVTARTKLILLNTPHNPTGKVFTARRARGDRRLALEHDLIVVTDEVYEHLVFDGRDARPDGDAAGHARAHAHDLVGRQDVPHDRLEDRLDVRPRGPRHGGADGQAVPHLRERRPVPTGDRGRARAARRVLRRVWPPSCRRARITSSPGCARPASRRSCPRRPTS